MPAELEYGIDWSKYQTEPCRKQCVRKATVPHTHNVRIPVGLDSGRWHNILEARNERAQYQHAKWAARGIARNVETFVRTGRWFGNELVGHVVTRRDAWDLLASGAFLKQAMRHYQVASQFDAECEALAMAFLKAAPKESGHGKTGN
jgi:hypothetical protein